MKQKNNPVSYFFSAMALFALVTAPLFGPPRRTTAQDRSININERLDVRGLGIDREARQVFTLIGTNAKFLNQASELQEKAIISPREATDLKNAVDQRKADVLTAKRELESLINKVKQKNRWDADFDAQFLASLKSDKDRSLLKQAGGARRLLESAVNEVGNLKDEIDAEVRLVSNKQTSALRHRKDESLTAHAIRPAGKICTVLLTAYFLASVGGTVDNLYSCYIAVRYRQKGCIPSPLDTDC